MILLQSTYIIHLDYILSNCYDFNFNFKCNNYIYVLFFSLLTKHAHEYMNTLELTKQQATANWLKDKSEREKELYLQRNRMIL